MSARHHAFPKRRVPPFPGPASTATRRCLAGLAQRKRGKFGAPFSLVINPRDGSRTYLQRAANLDIRLDSRRLLVAAFSTTYVEQGRAEVRTSTPELLEDEGKDVLIVDDLTDTGKTASVVRAMMPQAHFAAVYAKPKGRPLVDTFITEVSQDTWIYFPWDLGFAYQKPISQDGKH